jgi:methylase of polypeptide subunit release factors
MTRSQIKQKRLRVLDLCTGTGCILLLFHHHFYYYKANHDIDLHLTGVDISSDAVNLSFENQAIQLRALEAKHEGNKMLQSLKGLNFVQADILTKERDMQQLFKQSACPASHHTTEGSGHPLFDVLISNPPYISRRDYLRTTSRSVRHYEPRLALVPPSSLSPQEEWIYEADVFYPRLLAIAYHVGAQHALFEIGDLEQAKRVAAMSVASGYWTVVEIWRDEPGDNATDPEVLDISGSAVRVLGSGNGRSVFMCRRAGWT